MVAAARTQVENEYTAQVRAAKFADTYREVLQWSSI
jgi:hypothetical protein